MASATTASRRKQVFLGELPHDFLRIGQGHQEQQEAADQQAALALHHQLLNSPLVQNPVGRLNITVAQALLVKNYGMTRMDPYVRLRIGHVVLETHTDPNGGKNPHWNKTVQWYLPQGVNSLYVEIYDECSFKMDDLIAWAHIPISQAVLNGETIEDWFPLSGKQGDGKEGMINLVLSYTSAPSGGHPYMYGAGGPSVMMVPSTAQGGMFPVQQVSPVPVYTHVQPPPTVPVVNEADIKEISVMFPNMDSEALRLLYEDNHCNRELTINCILQMMHGTY